MSNPLFPVERGEPVKIQADTWNAFAAAARRDRDERGQQSARSIYSRSTQSLRCIVKNAITGPDYDMVRGSVGSLISNITPGATDFTEPYELAESGLFTVRRPLSTSSTTKAICVATEPIPYGEYGEVITSGIAICNVNKISTSDQYAVLESGRSDRLISSAYGNAYIMDSESGTGVKQAVVMLGASSRRQDVFARNAFFGTNTTTVMANTGLTAKLDGGQYIMRGMFSCDASITEGFNFDFGSIMPIGVECTVAVYEQTVGIINTTLILNGFSFSVSGFPTIGARMHIHIDGWAQVTVSGTTLIPRFAKNAAGAGSITFRNESFLEFTQLDNYS